MHENINPLELDIFCDEADEPLTLCGFTSEPKDYVRLVAKSAEAAAYWGSIDITIPYDMATSLGHALLKMANR